MKRVLLIALVFISTQCIGQKGSKEDKGDYYTFLYGKVDKVIKKEQGNYTLLMHDVRNANLGYEFDGLKEMQTVTLDNSGNVLEKTEFKVEVNGNKMKIYHAIRFNNSLYLIGVVSEKGNLIEKEARTIYAVQFNEETLKPDDKGILLDTITKYLKYESNDYLAEDLNGKYYEMALSPDQTKLALLVRSPKKGEELQSYNLIVFNEKFKVLARKECKMQYEDKLVKLDTILINNQGSLTVATQLKMVGVEDRSGKKPRVTTYKRFFNVSHLFTYPMDGSTPWEFTMQLPKMKTMGEIYNVLENGHVFYSGFYAGYENRDNKGAFVYELDTDKKEAIAKRHFQFDFDFVKSVSSKEDIKKFKGLNDYKMLGILPRKSGGFYLVSEKRYIIEGSSYPGQVHPSSTVGGHSGMGGTTVTTTTTAGGTTPDNFCYEDNIIFSLDEDLNLQWKKTCQKKQVATGESLKRGVYGTAYYVLNDNLYIMYNDSKTNTATTPHDKLKNFKNIDIITKTTLFTYAANGTQERSDFEYKPTARVNIPNLFWIDDNLLFAPLLATSGMEMARLKLVLAPGDEFMDKLKAVKWKE